MSKIVSFFSGCFLFITLTSISPAAETNAIALISSLKGKVELERVHQTGLRAAHLGEELLEDDVLYTGRRSRASLLFSDGSVINVYPNSRVELSLRDTDKRKDVSVAGSLYKVVIKGVQGIFSAVKERETLTAVPGIRKKIEEEEERGVRVSYPRNSMILISKPNFRWKTRGEGRMFMVSLTLKGMEGQLWTIRTKEADIRYPKGQKGLKRGQTYFLKVASVDDPSLSDEVYFRILEDQKDGRVVFCIGCFREKALIWFLIAELHILPGWVCDFRQIAVLVQVKGGTLAVRACNPKRFTAAVTFYSCDIPISILYFDEQSIAIVAELVQHSSGKCIHGA